MLLALLAVVTAAAKDAQCWVRGGRTQVEYTTAADLVADALREAELELREEVRFPPPNQGRLLFRIQRGTLDATRGQFQTIVLFDAAGTEILRTTGPDTIPARPTMAGGIGGGLWTTYAYVYVPETAVFPVRVAIADVVAEARCEWDLDAAGKFRVR